MFKLSVSSKFVRNHSINNLHIMIKKHRKQEIERILLATQLLLQVGENDGKRLAHQLRNEVGGILSGIKITLGNMKNNVMLTNDLVQGFNHVLLALDNRRPRQDGTFAILLRITHHRWKNGMRYWVKH